MEEESLVATMTIEEKCALLTGKDYWTLGGCSRLGIGSITVSDGPHGLRKQNGPSDNLGLSCSAPAVCFPTASALACSFDPAVARLVGGALADEAIDQGVDIVLGPAINMKRSPLCGRNFEYFSEDPHVVGRMACAYVEGLQERGVGASLKHFVANNQETNRLISDSVIDERALHELYLPAFRYVIEHARPWTVMTAYNLLNGTYCSENSRLMTDIARGEWGFDGTFVTDWGAENSNEKSLGAGLDVVMPGPRLDYRMDLVRAARAGDATADRLDDAVRTVLALHRKVVDEHPDHARTTLDERLDVARIAAEASAVLLENDGILPLKKETRVAVIGAFARHPRFQGAGSSRVESIVLDCALDALEESGVSCAYAAGYDLTRNDPDERLIAEAVHAACDADVACVFVGLPENAESESEDRTGLALPAAHNELVERICAAQGNTVVVLQTGSPVELPWRAMPRAILLSYLAGCRGGSATARLLLGEANPAGKLVETWPARGEDAPCCGFFPAKGRQALYCESIFSGYRFYDAAHVEVAYPFGYGLSYSLFSYRDLAIVEQDGFVEASCAVANDSDRRGKEAVQLYVAPLSMTTFHAPQLLKGFSSVELGPRESARVTFRLEREDFARYDPERSAWIVEDGDYELRVAASSRDVRLAGTLHVDGEASVDDGAPDVYRHVSPGAFTREAFAQLYGRPCPRELTPMRPYTINATVDDLGSSLMGKAVQAVVRHELKLFARKDPGLRESAERTILALPLRAFAMSGMDMDIVVGFVDVLNLHVVRGIRKIRSSFDKVRKRMAEIV